ncbi:ribosome maturation factor RimP, partial [Mycobacterium sp. ITM-2017-0098]
AVAELSRAASELLDALESAPYVLEVTSRGVDRPLTSEKHYRRSQGRLVEMSLSDGSVLTGRIGRVRDGIVDIVVRQVKKGPVVREIALDVITKAVVQVEFSSPSSRELELAGIS